MHTEDWDWCVYAKRDCCGCFDYKGERNFVAQTSKEIGRTGNWIPQLIFCQSRHWYQTSKMADRTSKWGNINVWRVGEKFTGCLLVLGTLQTDTDAPVGVRSALA